MLGVRRATALAAAVLALAVFNLTFRLGSEGLTEWDESLYATSALEMVRSHIGMASLVAEATLIWYSYNYRAFDRTAQGLLIVEEDRLRGVRVFRSSWDRADAFVLKGLIEAEQAEAISVQDFLFRSGPCEYFLTSRECDDPRLVQVAVLGEYALYQRREVNTLP